MPCRKIVIATGEIYHIFNRGIARSEIFESKRDYSRFQNIIEFYRFEKTPIPYSHFARLIFEEKEMVMDKLRAESYPQVELYVDCLMPNHFHLLLKQLKEFGISKFVANIQNAYAKYFNIKNGRCGSLFQSMFKAVRIENEEQLLHVSRYIHLNPCTSYLVEPQNILTWTWSSLVEYLEKRPERFLNTQLILNLIGGSKNYEKFVLDQVDYQRKLDQIKHLSIDYP